VIGYFSEAYRTALLSVVSIGGPTPLNPEMMETGRIKPFHRLIEIIFVTYFAPGKTRFVGMGN